MIRDRSSSTGSRRSSSRLGNRPTLHVALKNAKKEKKPKKSPDKWRSESPYARLDKIDLTTAKGIREMKFHIRNCYHYHMCYETA